MNWIFYALMSAFFASLTAILAKIGIKNIDSNLATAIRTVVILIIAWGIVFFQGGQKEIVNIPKNSLFFLILSGIATGCSWLFYFKALQMGEAAKVAPLEKISLVFTVILAAIILKEKISLNIIFGAILMGIGAILIGFGK